MLHTKRERRREERPGVCACVVYTRIGTRVIQNTAVVRQGAWDHLNCEMRRGRGLLRAFGERDSFRFSSDSRRPDLDISIKKEEGGGWVKCNLSFFISIYSKKINNVTCPVKPNHPSPNPKMGEAHPDPWCPLLSPLKTHIWKGVVGGCQGG